MAHTLDHIVAERLAADPSLAVDHPDYVAPIALGNYELPDFSVPPPYAGVYVPGIFGSVAERMAEYRAWVAQARAPLVFHDPAQQASYDAYREVREAMRSGSYRREERGEGVIAGGLEYISNIPGEIGEAAGEFVAGLGGGVGAGLGALTAPIVAAPGALLEGIPSWVPLLGAAYLLTRN